MSAALARPSEPIEGEEPTDGDFGRRLGEHLREIRRKKGTSLADVESASGGEFKASVLGAYERGERALSVGRLARLAAIYQVPLQAMLPRDESVSSTAPVEAGVALSLARLREQDTQETRALFAYARALQELRGDWAASVITIRGSDIYALASALGRPVAELMRRIDALGLRATP
jgi:transcriptional regulator with XRE-family HTH domain